MLATCDVRAAAVRAAARGGVQGDTLTSFNLIWSNPIWLTTIRSRNKLARV
jgi:hypothetical protein